MKNKLLLLLFALHFVSNAQISLIGKNELPEVHTDLIEFSKRVELEQQKRVNDYIQKNKISDINVFNEDGTFSTLYDITPNGFPLYKSLDNIDAAKSTRTGFMHGFLGLNMEGQNVKIGVWDGGPALATHDEFTIGPSNPTSRIFIGDNSNPNTNSEHGTHVTGTIASRGKVFAAKGMAPQIQVRSHDWSNDFSEVSSATQNSWYGSNGILVSNHSYGTPITDSNGNFQLEDWYPGCYSSASRNWDVLAYNAPYYLMVASAGNEGNSVNPYTFHTGFDKLTGNKISKNNLVIANTQDANVNSLGELISVSINSSSSQGPSDDRRVKPDIAGNGTGVYSPVNSGNSDYDTFSGTSMAAPNVSGSIILLQQYCHSLTSDYMLSSTLKGLVCHTASDAGAEGPDPYFGWGLLDMKTASSVLTDANNSVPTAIVKELTMTNNNVYEVQVTLNSPKNLKATICWTDIPGLAKDEQLNSTIPVLVCDLDLRIIKGEETHYPWKLQLNPSLPAVKGDNNVDNVEKVEVNNAETGVYTIRVTHKGILSQGQVYSLIVSGFDQTTLHREKINFEGLAIYPNPTNDILNFQTDNNLQIDNVEVYDVVGKKVFASNVNGNNSINISALNSGVYFVKVYSGKDYITRKVVKK